jgi:hypothetical protein
VGVVDVAWWAFQTGGDDFSVSGEVDELVLETFDVTELGALGGNATAFLTDMAKRAATST